MNMHTDLNSRRVIVDEVANQLQISHCSAYETSMTDFTSMKSVQDGF
jgi:hypothetical protein